MEQVEGGDRPVSLSLNRKYTAHISPPQGVNRVQANLTDVSNLCFAGHLDVKRLRFFPAIVVFRCIGRVSLSIPVFGPYEIRDLGRQRTVLRQFSQSGVESRKTSLDCCPLL